MVTEVKNIIFNLPAMVFEKGDYIVTDFGDWPNFGDYYRRFMRLRNV